MNLRLNYLVVVALTKSLRLRLTTMKLMTMKQLNLLTLQTMIRSA